MNSHQVLQYLNYLLAKSLHIKTKPLQTLFPLQVLQDILQVLIQSLLINNLYHKKP